MTAECVVLNLRAANKQELLAGLAERVAPAASQDGFDVFRALLARESQGSTSLGMGAALPNARFKQLHRPFALFARLWRPIDFDALDRRPVDLVFLLLGPEPADAAYLEILGSVSRVLRNSAVRDQLRACADVQSILSLLKNESSPADKLFHYPSR